MGPTSIDSIWGCLVYSGAHSSPGTSLDSGLAIVITDNQNNQVFPERQQHLIDGFMYRNKGFTDAAIDAPQLVLTKAAKVVQAKKGLSIYCVFHQLRRMVGENLILITDSLTLEQFGFHTLHHF